jgi:hypothetical protein
MAGMKKPGTAGLYWETVNNRFTSDRDTGILGPILGLFGFASALSENRVPLFGPML